MHLRRFNLRMSALELFLVDQTNSFLNFPTFKRRNKIFLKIFSLRPPNMVFQGTRSPKGGGDFPKPRAYNKFRVF